jgi:arsenate reductase
MPSAEHPPRRVLIICTGNSCRSQMAEGLVNYELGGLWHAFSAGTRPSAVHPLAIAAMREIGIDISGQASKHVDTFRHEAFDLVVSVCSDAERECPLWPGGRRLHCGFDDPAMASGSDEEIMNAYRRSRDEIRARLLPLLAGAAAC